MEQSYTERINEQLRAAFTEVMVSAGELIDKALDEHLPDMKMIFLRDRALTVSLGLEVKMNEAGQIEVGLTTGYIKERVKDKTTARVTPGQAALPGTEQGETTVTITTADGQSATGSLRDLADGVAKIKASRKKAG